MTRHARRVVEAFLDLLLGPRCHHCRTRVFPRDTVAHYRVCSQPWLPTPTTRKGRS